MAVTVTIELEATLNKMSMLHKKNSVSKCVYLPTSMLKYSTRIKSKKKYVEFVMSSKP